MWQTAQSYQGVSSSHAAFAASPGQDCGPFRRLTCDGDHIAAFREAMVEAGVGAPPEVVPDGRLHRFRGEGDRPGRLNGWYVLHLDGRPAGMFGSWRLGVAHTWRADGPPPSEAERRELRRRLEEARRRAEEEQSRQWREAARRAWCLWQQARPADPRHPYLERKRIGPHHLRQRGDHLLVPIVDLGGRLWNLQAIAPDGTKRFLRDGRVAGLACIFGSLAEADRVGVVIVAEGAATAATVREATALPVLAALSAGNLEAVARGVRRRLPDARLIVAADHDPPGLEAARRAAAAAGGEVVVPSTAGADFNDLGVAHARATFAMVFHEAPLVAGGAA